METCDALACVGNCPIDLRVWTLMRLGMQKQDGKNLEIVWLLLLQR